MSNLHLYSSFRKSLVVLFFLLFFLALPALNAQTLSLEEAVEAAGLDLVKNMEQGSVVAIINFTSPSEPLSQYVADELTAFIVQTRLLKVVDRNRMEFIRNEQNFQMSGDVSDESMQSIGKILGARSIITGSFTKSGQDWRFVIIGLNVESGLTEFIYRANVAEDPQILFWVTGKRPPDPKAAHLWTLGVSAGSSFATPLVIATVHGTIAPFTYSFLELGCDIGWVSTVENAVYYFLYPFAHYSLFLPIGNNSGWYIGAGGGWMYGSYTVDDLSLLINEGAMDLTTGFNIFNYIDISYTLRTNFKSANHKASLGFVYRFR